MGNLGNLLRMGDFFLFLQPMEWYNQSSDSFPPPGLSYQLLSQFTGEDGVALQQFLDPKDTAGIKATLRGAKIRLLKLPWPFRLEWWNLRKLTGTAWGSNEQPPIDYNGSGLHHKQEIWVWTRYKCLQCISFWTLFQGETNGCTKPACPVFKSSSIDSFQCEHSTKPSYPCAVPAPSHPPPSAFIHGAVLTPKIRSQ